MRISALLSALLFIVTAFGCHHHGGRNKPVLVPPGKVKPLPPGKLKKLSLEPAQGPVKSADKLEI